MVTVRGCSDSRRINSRTSASATAAAWGMRQHHRRAAGGTQVGSEPGRMSHFRPIVRCPGDDHIANLVGAQCRDQPVLQGLGRQDLGGDSLLLNPAGRLSCIAHRNQHPRDRQVLQGRRDRCSRLISLAKQDRHAKAGGQRAAEDHGLRIIGQRHDDFARLVPEPLRHRRAGLRSGSLPICSTSGDRFCSAGRASSGSDVASTIGRRTWGQRQQPLGLPRRRTGDRHDQSGRLRLVRQADSFFSGRRVGRGFPQMCGRRRRQGHGPWLVVGGENP